MHIVVRSILGIVMCWSSATWANDAHFLSHLLTKNTSYQAHFVQTPAQGALGESGEGMIYVAGQKNMRWEAWKPTHQIFLIKDSFFWIYDVDLRQATRQTLSEQYAISPLSLLTGSERDWKKKFRITAIATQKDSQFMVIPRSPSADFKKIILMFRNNELTRMMVWNDGPGMLDFRFDHIVLNKPFASTLFEPRFPPGVDVVLNEAQ